MVRIVRPEILDALPGADPAAVRSRADLRRINLWMGHRDLLRRLLAGAAPGGGAVRLTELGAGDGTLLCAVARGLPWRKVRARLVDREALLSAGTRAEFARLGWEVEAVAGDVFDLLAEGAAEGEVVVANLFLHHFGEESLRDLLALAARGARAFVALEPRRGIPGAAASRLLGLLGCGPVTRHDARVSVRAGFAGTEIGDLWPEPERWEIREGRAGLFSHAFTALRAGVAVAEGSAPEGPPARPRGVPGDGKRTPPGDGSPE